MDKLSYFYSEFKLFVKTILFWQTFGMIIASLAVFLMFTFWWLRCYTNHGESLQVHNYTGMHLEDAERKAEERSFRVVVSDSVFMVGTRGGMVLDQNPKPFSRVKENRTIYLVVSCYNAKMVKVPNFFNKDDYNQYTKVLKSLGVDFSIREHRYDPKLEDNTIMEVYYKGENITQQIPAGVMVEKGGALEFVISQRTGTDVEVPDLVCQTYDAASFLLSSNNLNIGEISSDGSVTDQNSAYIWKQEPAYQPGAS